MDSAKILERVSTLSLSSEGSVSMPFLPLSSLLPSSLHYHFGGGESEESKKKGGGLGGQRNRVTKVKVKQGGWGGEKEPRDTEASELHRALMQAVSNKEANRLLCLQMAREGEGGKGGGGGGGGGEGGSGGYERFNLPLPPLATPSANIGKLEKSTFLEDLQNFEDRMDEGLEISDQRIKKKKSVNFAQVSSLCAYDPSLSIFSRNEKVFEFRDSDPNCGSPEGREEEEEEEERAQPSDVDISIIYAPGSKDSPALSPCLETPTKKRGEEREEVFVASLLSIRTLNSDSTLASDLATPISVHLPPSFPKKSQNFDNYTLETKKFDGPSSFQSLLSGESEIRDILRSMGRKGGRGERSKYMKMLQRRMIQPCWRGYM